jgi:hypothetical protein
MTPFGFLFGCERMGYFPARGAGVSPVRQHLQAAQPLGRTHFPGSFVPASRLVEIGRNAADAAVGENDRIVGRPERHRRGGVARVGGAREKDARGNQVTGLDEMIAGSIRSFVAKESPTGVGQSPVSDREFFSQWGSQNPQSL